MRAWIQLVVAVLLVLSLFGCATTGPRFSEMRPTLSKINPNMGRIYIYRKTLAGAMIQPQVFVNDVEVGTAVPRGFFYMDRAPGNYQIKTTTEVKRTLSLTLKAREIRYVRLNISFGFFVGHVYPDLVDNEVGETEIKSLRYTRKE